MILLRGIWSLRPEETREQALLTLMSVGAFWCSAGATVPCHGIVFRAEQQQKMLCVTLVLLLGDCNAGGAFLDVYITNATSMHDMLVSLM